jgi:hypothetical protein
MVVKGKLSKSRMAALAFFADELLTRQMQRHIMLTVTFKSKMKALGLTCVEDYNLAGKPREFIIEVNRNQTEDEILRTIAHEMVHVKQYVYGELNEEATYWCGETLAIELEYHEQPWEIEAHDVGDIIFNEYMEKHNVQWS